MSFDQEPDAPIHDECAEEIHKLRASNAALRAAVDKSRTTAQAAFDDPYDRNIDRLGQIKHYCENGMGRSADAAADLALIHRAMRVLQFTVSTCCNDPGEEEMNSPGAHALSILSELREIFGKET